MTKKKRREWVRIALSCGVLAAMAVGMLLLFSGCYTQGKAAEQMDKAHARYEIVAAGRCASWYPVLPDTVFGPVIIRRDTTWEPGQIIYADCDSALKAANAGRRPDTEPAKPGKVGVKCPDQLIIHDSIDRPVYITKVDSASVRKWQLQAETETRRANTNKMWAWVFGILSGLLAIGLFFTVKHIKA